MTPERWRQIEELYHSARERGCEVLADVGSELRSEVEKLLAQDSGGKILDRPAAYILQDSTLTPVVAPGSQMGPYRIVAQIGEGGMGTVYKARDTRLDRIVALKVSKEKFSERFEHEARAVAALNHPNICTLYDVGPDYLVMEYVEGSTLKGPLPVSQALKYAGQICEALDAAHQKGITHLDLKPGNILVTKSGVKLLDFGLARIEGGKSSTVTIGAVKGTPAYMAPEQWDGKPGDARSDIFAFGCVLYEMLTGKRAAAHRVVLGAADLENLVNTCLAPDPEDRWQSAKNLRQALMTIGIANSAARPSPWRERTGWITAAIGIVAALFFWLPRSSAPAAGEVMRLSINPPENAVFTPPSNATIGVPQIALSPDGHTLAFVANRVGARPQLWLSSLQTGIARPMPGTEGANLPFWSPDSRWVGFFAGGKLKKIPLADGPAEDIVDVEEPRGGSWGPDDTILIARDSRGLIGFPPLPAGRSHT
jgi:predicted Ser/Thr protein kinase